MTPYLGVEVVEDEGLQGAVTRHEPLGGVVGDDSAEIEEHDTVGDALEQGEVVGAQHDRTPVGAQPDELLLAQAERTDIDAVERLVDDRQRSPHQQSGDDLRLLPHTVRVVLDEVVQPSVHAESGEQLGGIARLEPVQARDHREILPAGQELGQEVVARQVQGGILRRRRGVLTVGDRDGSGLQGQQVEHDPDQGRLSRAVRSDETDHLTVRRRQVDVVEHAHPLLVREGHAADVERGHRVTPTVGPAARPTPRRGSRARRTRNGPSGRSP